MPFIALVILSNSSNWTKISSFCKKINSGYKQIAYEETFKFCRMHKYRSGTVNSKSFVGKVLLQIKWKFELN